MIASKLPSSCIILHTHSIMGGLYSMGSRGKRIKMKSRIAMFVMERKAGENVNLYPLDM